ncbi:MAG: HAMP domain-containing sensor histidine kinase [Pseudomonadota bacterium]
MTTTAILTAPGAAPSSQNQVLFRIYLIYRSILSVVFLLLILLPATRELVGAESELLYTSVSLVFLLSNILLLAAVAARWHQSNSRLVLIFCIDIACIMLLSDASGGMSSGLPLLLTITVASSAILISNRTVATLVAAITAIAILADTLWLSSRNAIGITGLFPAGLLGALFFLVSGIVQLIALRLGRVEAIATERASDLYRLQRLNEQIVQYMQTGILLIDREGRARVMNAAAGRLLDPTRPVALEQGRAIGDYSRDLEGRLKTFLTSGRQSETPFKAREEGAEISVRFHVLETGEESQTLAFLEDYRPVAAYAQSLKLSSLGRLAGSIAHEIRNPLGAISHATQLLQESSEVTQDDRHMLDMVMANSQRVNEIVESVLQISRREPPAPESLVLAEWLEEYVDHYRLARETPGALIVEYADPEAHVRMDPEHLQRVLDNLVDNAMRHSELETGAASAELRVRVDGRRQECAIDVYDDGDGVQEADIPRLFEPFFTKSRSGSGLGLYLCRELCELNQGQIAYAPTSDGRSRFQIRLQQQEA